MTTHPLNTEAVAGGLLLAAAAAALAIANSPLAPIYFGGLERSFIGASALHWINDGLMALFFLLVGLETKRELIEGRLATWPARILPGIAALGGMIVPALLYVGLNAGSPDSLRGWAVSSATDIAFALGVLALLGSRVPASLKVFLTALAVLDDLGAVAIIALVHNTGLSWSMLAAAGAVLYLLAILSWLRVARIWPYLLLGGLLWFFIHRAGLHPTLAGVLVAFAIPLHPWNRQSSAGSPLLRLESLLKPWVTFLVLPLFGFANAGLSLAGQEAMLLAAPVPLGIGLGLFLGKQLGIVAFARVAIGLKWSRLPARSSWAHFHGVALLCGIGFTMSLLLGLLAFPESGLLQDQAKLGVLAGSLASAVAGTILLLLAGPPRPLVSRTVPSKGMMPHPRALARDMES